MRFSRFSGTSVPRDFVEFPSQVNEPWALFPKVLQNYARHWQTGEPLPEKHVAALLASQKFNNGYAKSEFLAAAVVDQAWHSLAPEECPGPEGVEEFERRALASAGLDLPLVPPRCARREFLSCLCLVLLVCRRVPHPAAQVVHVHVHLPVVGSDGRRNRPVSVAGAIVGRWDGRLFRPRRGGATTAAPHFPLHLISFCKYLLVGVVLFFVFCFFSLNSHPRCRYRSGYFSHVFADSYASCYQSYLRSEVLDADGEAWFKEHGGLTRENGDHFRRTVLSKGGSVDPNVLVRDFLGREPSIGPLLVRLGFE